MNSYAKGYALAVFAMAVALYVAVVRSGIGREVGDHNASLLGSSTNGVACGAIRDGRADNPSGAKPPADARLSGQEVQRAERPAEKAVGGAGSSPALATLLDQFEFSTPTAEDIAWLTIDSWSQPEFLELTQEEAHELLALDDTMGLKGPDTMLSIAGPLPTLDDCRIAFRSQAVQAALSEALMWNALVIECGVAEIEKPTLRGNRHVREAKEIALKRQVAAEEALMVELERATTYPSWRLYWRLYRRWVE